MHTHPFVKEVIGVFEKTADRYKAHDLCLPVLKQMAGNGGFIQDVMTAGFSDPLLITARRDYSRILKFRICRHPEFEMVLNIFPPNPFTKESLSVKSIHHHGDMLVTSITAWGHGYESILFKPICPGNAGSLQYDRLFKQEPGNYTFLDTGVPHVVFFPEALTATISLWSMNRKRRIEQFKSLEAVIHFKEPLVKLARMLGMRKIPGLNRVSDVYYTVDEERILKLRQPVKYPGGTQSDSLFNLLSFAYQAGFKNTDVLKEIIRKREISFGVKKMFFRFIESPGEFSEFKRIHVFNAQENILKERILKAAESAGDI